MSQTTGGIGTAQDRPYGIAPAGWRLPSAATLGAVDLQVANLARSLDYYERGLGFRRLEMAGGVASLAPAATDVPLVRLHERPGATPVPSSGRLGLYHYAILLPDRAALGRFIRHASSIGLRFGASDHLVSEALYLRDPDGLGIEIYSDRPRDAWRTAGEQLEMATLPLDLQSLVEASHGQSWTGMPEGTRMGHVHLHVDDLDRAADFYHEGVGLDKIVWSYPGALFLAAGGYHHHLGLNTWARGAARAGEGDARLLEWEILLPSSADVDSTVESLHSKGLEPVESAPGNVLFVDPTGTGIRFRTG